MKLCRWMLLFSALFSMPGYAQLADAPLPQAGAKKEGPSLEETQRWIADKLHEAGWHAVQRGVDADPNGWRGVRYEAYFKGCEFTVAKVDALNYRNSYRPKKFQNIQSTDFIRTDGNLAWLVGSSASSNQLFVTEPGQSLTRIRTQIPDFTGVVNSDRAALEGLLPAKDSAPRDSLVSNKYGDGYYWIAVDHEKSVSFSTLDEVIQGRVANAFRHAADLCFAQEAARRQAEREVNAKKPGDLF